MALIEEKVIFGKAHNTITFIFDDVKQVLVGYKIENNAEDKKIILKFEKEFIKETTAENDSISDISIITAEQPGYTIFEGTINKKAVLAKRGISWRAYGI